MVVSPRFQQFAQNNLDYWLEKTRDLSDVAFTALREEREPIFRAVRAGLDLEPCRAAAAQLTLQVFRMVELLGYWQEWIPVVEEALAVAPTEATRTRLLNQLGFLHRLNGNLEEAIAVHHQTIAQAEQAGDTAELARAYFHLATDYRESYDYDAAVRYAELAGEAFEASGTVSPRNQAALANLHGLIAQHQGQYEEAVTQYNVAIPLWREIGESAYLLRTLRNKGLSLEQLQRYEDALHVYDQAMDSAEAAGMELEKVAISINRGNIFYRLREWSRAIESYASADTPELRTSGNLEHQGLIAMNLGHVYLEVNELFDAAAHLEIGIGFWVELGDDVRLANTLCTLGDVRCRQEAFADAHARYQEALQLSTRHPQDALARRVRARCEAALSALSEP